MARIAKKPSTSHPSKRIVWNPRVHRELFDSSCYYFALRLRNPFGADYTAIKDIITEKCGIVSPAIYEVYGFFDYLVRFWSGPGKRALFIQALEGREEVRAVIECCFHKVKYYWWQEFEKSAMPQSLGSLKLAIANANGRIPRDATAELHEDLKIAELETKGLLKLKQRGNGNRVKFYILISRPGITTLAHRNEIQGLHEKLKTLLDDQILKLKLEDVSLYVGDLSKDMVPFLIKAETQTFDLIRQLAEVLAETISHTDFRTTTLLVKQTHVLGQEILDASPTLSPTLGVILQRAGVDLKNQETQLSGDDRYALDSILEEYAALLEADGGEHNTILSLASAFVFVRVNGEADGKGEMWLTMALTFLPKLEAYLREFFIRTCASKLGPTWFKDIQPHAHSAAIQAARSDAGAKSEDGMKRPKPASDYTLHDTVTMLDKLVKNDVLPQSELDQSLGLDWEKNLRLLIDTRNASAHGRSMIGHLSDAEKFRAFARKVLDGASILENLKRS